MRTAAFIVALGVAAGASTIGHLRTEAPTGERPSFLFGLNPISYTGDGPPAADFDDAKALGANSMRLWANWRRIETRPGRYDFSALDRNIADAASRGLEPFLAVAGAPLFACATRVKLETEDNLCAPQLPPYRAFLERLAARYKGRVRHYEIWNEPNLEYYWLPKPDPAGYASLLLASHEVLKKIDSSGNVLFAGLAGVDLEYTAGVLRALGGRRAFDSIAVHPYRFSEDFINKHGPFDKKPFYLPNVVTEATLKEELVTFIDMFTQHGYGRPDLYLTEMGWGAYDDTNNGLNVTLQEQARFLTETFDLVTRDSEMALIIKGVFWFCDRDWAVSPDQPHVEEFGFYGLLRADRRWKPAAHAFKAVSARGSQDRAVRPPPSSSTQPPATAGLHLKDPWADAQERRIEFRAIGQEPGWYLEIDHEKSMKLVYDYLAQTVITPAPKRTLTGQRVIYEAATADHRLRVAIEKVTCRDVMSGGAFLATVTVTIDGRELRGCGRDLQR